MNDTPHDHDHPGPGQEPGPSGRRPRPAESPEVQDAGSRALADALRSSFFFVKLVMIILALAFVFAGARIVKPGERAVLLRLGKPKSEKLLEPGLHLAFPPPIDEIVRIPIGEIQSVKSTVGWYVSAAVPGTPESDQAPNTPTLNPAMGGYALTADTNIVHVTATLRYRVQDAVAYAFQFSDASNVVQNALNNAVIYAAAHTPLDEALRQPDVFKARMMTRVDDLASRLELGITLEPSEVRIVAPGYVQPDIDAVKTAESTGAEKINTAKGEAEALLAKAIGEVSSITNAAAAESNRYLREIQEFAASYQKQLPEYKKNPELFRQRLLTETWQQVLVSAADKFFIPDRADGRPRELRLQINKEPEKPKTAAETQPGAAQQ